MSDDTSIQALIDIMARLRDPDGGCPWDLRQTFRTILPHTLEEAYEVAEAIEQDDMPGLCDELGDLLLQVVFHARMAEEQGHFDFFHVVRAICDKLIRRHPHIFEDANLADAGAVRANWEQIKASERAGRAEKGDETPHGVLTGVAQALPALVRAEKLQRRASRVGFDWDAVEAVFDTVGEELAECRETLAEHADPAERVHEIGDLLFSCVNLARHMGVDAEQALRAANQRFEWRFAQVENALGEQGLEPCRAQREAMEVEWNLAKMREPFAL